MSDGVWVAIIGGCATVAAAIVTGWLATRDDPQPAPERVPPQITMESCYGRWTWQAEEEASSWICVRTVLSWRKLWLASRSGPGRYPSFRPATRAALPWPRRTQPTEVGPARAEGADTDILASSPHSLRRCLQVRCSMASDWLRQAGQVQE